MTKCISISWVSNEADIVEAWVRHNCRYVGRMVIIVRTCEDNTEEILTSLQQEGLAIDVRHDSGNSHDQGGVLTQCLQDVVTQDSSFWILPLDADEFLSIPLACDLVDILSRLPKDAITQIPWKTYIPTLSDPPAEPCLLKRIQHRRGSENPQYHKVLIPPSIATLPTIRLSLGCHTVYDRNTDTAIDSIPTDSISLAHFPVRTEDQLRTKIFSGWLSLRADPKYTRGEAFQWKDLFDLLKENHKISPEELQCIALGYAVPENVLHEKDVDFILDPVPTFDIALRYEARCINPWKLLANRGEELASLHARTSSTSPTTGDAARSLAEKLAILTHELQEKGLEIADLLTVTLIFARICKGSEYSWLDVRSLLSSIPQQYGSLRDLISSDLTSVEYHLEIKGMISTLRGISTEELEFECNAAQNNDVLTHIHEAFLASYATSSRNWRCAFYTPKPLVSYAVSSLHALANQTDVELYTLDIASGTGPLLLGALQQTLHDGFAGPQRFGCIEYMQTSHLLMHLQAGELVKMHGLPPESSLRIRSRVGDVYQDPNVLSRCFPELLDERIAQASSLSLFSNPPYNQFSNAQFPADSSAAHCFSRYLRPIEKTGLDTQPLRADYIKFTALVHDTLLQVPRGCACLTIRNAFLNSHAHLGMRKELLKDFDQIYILNLRGDPSDRLQDPKYPDDENVYATMVGHDLGMCMLFLVRNREMGRGVFYADLYGSREEKYQFLSSNTLQTTMWTSLTPSAPYYLFAPSPAHAQALQHPVDQEMQEPAQVPSLLYGRLQETLQ